MKYLVFFILSSNLVLGNFSNNRYGAGLDIGSKGSGFFFNYLIGNMEKNLDIVFEARYFDIKGETEMYVYDYWTNQYTTISGQNLILMPFMIGINYHPFAGQIANNFSPFISLRGGGLFTLNGAEVGSFRQRWENVETQFTLGGFFGGGIDFKMYGQTTVSSMVGYEILPLKDEADGEKDYSGMLIHIAFNRRVSL